MGKKLLYKFCVAVSRVVWVIVITMYVVAMVAGILLPVALLWLVFKHL